ncbi:heme/copper-type cytochrome/quinol oxidase, subunit 2 [Terriglobus roseus DSM 18391]|uniref:Heme/copper-type cytochrome/quinol oxidase, subunit 2 n=1 Tax=Terriglobus roseus (strain DSM 18391 / NRRL B-41598 / KBS 63) TaxID=926566 RepID=I3ZE28_TERRK|nr:cupredoxin domain-containing protein [Terriglobus roseus]AFL87496.1 heme/copper-type cytochrome/quinol oxidase, subunit 2 [Terriglobus roseus DSM 18391]
MQARSLVAAGCMVLLVSGSPALNLRLRGSDNPQTVPITAKRYEFTPNELTLKVNEPVVLVFKSDDATHGMHFEDLNLDAVIAKGTGAEVKFTPDKTGDFVGHCAVFCGTGHGGMTLTIHVVP